MPFAEWVRRLAGDATGSEAMRPDPAFDIPDPDRRAAARLPRHGRRGGLPRAGAGHPVERAVSECGALARARSALASRPAGAWRGRRGLGGDPLGRHRTAPGVGARRRGRRVGRRRLGGTRRRPRAAPWSSSGWAAASALGLYLGVPETDHVVGIAAVLAAVLLGSLAAPGPSELGAGRRSRRRAGLDRRARGAGRRTRTARRAGDAGPPRRRARDVAPPRTAAPDRARLDAACRVDRAAGRLHRRHRSHRGTSRHDRRRLDRSSPSVSSCSWRRPAWPSDLDRGEAGVRRRRRGHAAGCHRTAARRDRRGDPGRRRCTGAVPPGAQRSRRPALRARQVPHDATGPVRRDRSAARRGAPDARGPACCDRRASTSCRRSSTWCAVRCPSSAPGPFRSSYLPRFDDTQARRLEIRPGITGWAQVNGRNTTAWDERLAMDVWYVDHASQALDVRILATHRRHGAARQRRRPRARRDDDRVRRTGDRSEPACRNARCASPT